LFHVVVDDSHVAEQCIELLNKSKLGRLTFLPLDNLHPTVVDQSKIDAFHADRGIESGSRARELDPMIGYIKFEPAIRPAVDTIWGNVLLAKDIDVANAAAKRCNAECITQDGVRVCPVPLLTLCHGSAEKIRWKYEDVTPPDVQEGAMQCCCVLQALSKGTVEGGYVDSRKLRIRIYKEMKELEMEAARRRAHHVEIREQLTEMEKGLKAAGDRAAAADRARKNAQAQEADMHARLLELKRQVRAFAPLRSGCGSGCDASARLSRRCGHCARAVLMPGTRTTRHAVQGERQQTLKQKKVEHAAKLAASCENAQRRVQRLQQEMASQMAPAVTERDRSRVTTLEVCSRSMRLQRMHAQPQRAQAPGTAARHARRHAQRPR
jgi:SMC proteins Flexible Hinge Domain